MQCPYCRFESAHVFEKCPACGAQVGSVNQANVNVVASSVKEQRPSAAGQIVMGVINLICCGFMVSSVLGIVAIIMAAMGSSDQNIPSAKDKIRTAKILNIVGLVFLAMQFGLLLLSLVLRVSLDPGRWSRYR